MDRAKKDSEMVQFISKVYIILGWTSELLLLYVFFSSCACIAKLISGYIIKGIISEKIT